MAVVQREADLSRENYSELRIQLENKDQEVIREQERVSDLELEMIKQSKENEERQRTVLSYQKMLKQMESNITHIKQKERTTKTQYDDSAVQLA